MAYRKTEAVLAALEARRAAILTATIDTIAKAGIDALTTDAIAERAGIAAGLLYKYFPDKTELLAQATATVLARDLGAMRSAAEGLRPLDALAAALAVFYGGLRRPHLVRAMGQQSAYRAGVRAEFATMIRAADSGITRDDAVTVAGATLGAFYGSFDAGTRSIDRAPTALLYALRGMGVSDATARRAAEKALA